MAAGGGEAENGVSSSYEGLHQGEEAPVELGVGDGLLAHLDQAGFVAAAEGQGQEPMPVTLRPVLLEVDLSSSRTWRALAKTAAPSPSARHDRLKVSWTWTLVSAGRTCGP